MKIEDENLVNKLEKEVGYIFKNKTLALEALIHPSCDNKSYKQNNERLEFLGDAVLNLVISEMLYSLFNKIQEDKLSRMRSKLVSCEGICEVAEKFNIKDKIKLSNGEERNQGRDNPRNIENATEAIIGAIYLDAGIEKTKEIVAYLWKDIMSNIKNIKTDVKTFLQEWSQENYNQIPKYELIDRTGPSHAPEFNIQVSIDKIGQISAKGTNKKEAEKNAAKCFIEKYIKPKNKQINL